MDTKKTSQLLPNHTKITLVLCDNMLASSCTLPIEMLRTAEGAARGKKRHSTRLDIQTVSSDGKPVVTSSGFTFTPSSSIANCSDSDYIYVPSLWRNPSPVVRSNQPLVNWLRDQADTGAIINGVGTGCCFLAEAGLLNHKPATTHWHYFDQFEKHYPDADLKREYFITQAGNIYCAASVNSLADLTVHFVSEIYDNTIANHVQRHFSHEIRSDYKNTSYFEEKINRHPDEDIVHAQRWLKDNFAKEFKLSEVATQFDMSVRTFNRRFKKANGKTPLQHLQNIRIDVAKDLLKNTNLSIGEISLAVGYLDMGHFAEIFKKNLAITPSEYRTTVRAKLFAAEDQ
ncbi:AraC family transcriptional regulator [Gammaproteobacteria bacterium 45_16_T64]|nr:AraC family transcriptional regulator [Gammaproteobacteria bacterium 45_16_T64]